MVIPFRRRRVEETITIVRRVGGDVPDFPREMERPLERAPARLSFIDFVDIARRSEDGRATQADALALAKEIMRRVEVEVGKGSASQADSAALLRELIRRWDAAGRWS